MAERREKNSERKPARERILHHAIRRFSTQSYETTGLREIAADAHVDVAWVHRSFGSKEKLFEECLKFTIASDAALRDLGADSLERLCAQILQPREPGELRPIDIIVRSLASPEASTVIKKVSQALIIEPLLQKASPTGGVPVVLALSMMLGMAIMRDVVKLELLANAGPDQIQHAFMAAVDVMKASPVEPLSTS
jgi:AcrR family transcriptional regulator